MRERTVRATARSGRSGAMGAVAVQLRARAVVDWRSTSSGSKRMSPWRCSGSTVSAMSSSAAAFPSSYFGWRIEVRVGDSIDGEFDVVVADDAHVAWHPYPALRQCPQHPESDLVIHADHRGRPVRDGEGACPRLARPARRR